MEELKNAITSQEQLRAVVEEPLELLQRKVSPQLNANSKVFIRRSPFVVIASANSQGKTDVSPKGDPPGFVKILSDTRLAVPDRPGNRRVDTFVNVLQNPDVGLIFFIPGKGETLRVFGKASIFRDQALLESMALNGKTPHLALIIDVEGVLFQCSKSVIRSGLWRKEKWPSLDGLPNLAQALKTGIETDMSLEQISKFVDDDEKDNLY